jgi:Mg-chelatase subunit ChlD
MNNQKPVCPKCGETGQVDSGLKCATCGEQLEYQEAGGVMRLAEKERHCPRCDKTNSKDVKFCESCGAQIGKFCGYCKTYHFIEDKVCPKTGEPIKGEEKSARPAPSFEKILVTASIIAIFFIGALIFKLSHSSGTTPPRPIGTPTHPNQWPVGKGPSIDVVFVVDSTGSMGDEIEVVKGKLRDMINLIASGQPKPYVRYGLVAYRDKGDVFVTKKYDLSDSLNSIQSNVNELAAEGGGDTPESVNEAMNVAINEMSWDKSANTSKLVFLIGDSGPHTDYQEPYNYRSLAQQAKEKGIKISAIGCSGITSSGENEFREVAQVSGGQFDFLTYQQAYTRSDGTVATFMKAGDKDYEVTGASEETLKDGYRVVLEKKNAKPAAPSAIAEQAKMKAGKMENNLDSVMTEQVMREAEVNQGVKYIK